jgi:beta-lactam-binding protein with PASTA domain
MKVNLTVALLVALTLTGCGGDPEPQIVPDLRGVRLDVAERRLDDRGLAETRLDRRELGYEVESLFEERFDVPPSWLVCEQAPSAGERASRVVLFAARRCEGAAEPVVPNVVGEDLDDAETLLEERGIGYAVFPGDVEPERRRLWEVCEQDPGPGEEGALVDLHVARNCPD